MFAPVVEYYKATGARRKTRPIATALGYSRQYYYKLHHQSLLSHQKNNQILTLVKNERKILPQIGCRKLHEMIREALIHKSIKCGRDQLFSLLSRHGMLIKPKRRYVQTTNSKHWLRKYPNIAKDALIDGPEQLWVSDITYIKTLEGNCYLNLLTDAFSRKIVGYAINDNMETESMIKAYSKAISEKQNTSLQTIHHSDRGLQYCSKDYVKLSEQNNNRISMTENGDPYENALAERMNRTLKEEFGLGAIISSRKVAYKLAEEAVFLYNNYRPHTALKYLTPEQVHKKSPTNLILSGT